MTAIVLTPSPSHGLSSLPEVHLTRRGRFVRAVAILALFAFAAWTAVPLFARYAPEVHSSPVGNVRPVLQVVVQEGDSLWLIARRTAPDADPREVVTDIRELNQMTSNLIHPGQSLLVPASS
jgi:hypothetical protein